jgi:hypothetical protein
MFNKPTLASAFFWLSGFDWLNWFDRVRFGFE